MRDSWYIREGFESLLKEGLTSADATADAEAGKKDGVKVLD